MMGMPAVYKSPAIPNEMSKKNRTEFFRMESIDSPNFTTGTRIRRQSAGMEHLRYRFDNALAIMMVAYST